VWRRQYLDCLDFIWQWLNTVTGNLMPKQLDFLLKQGTLSGFRLESHFSQAVEDLSQPLEKLLWRAGIYYCVIKIT